MNNVHTARFFRTIGTSKPFGDTTKGNVAYALSTDAYGRIYHVNDEGLPQYHGAANGSVVYAVVKALQAESIEYFRGKPWEKPEATA